MPHHLCKFQVEYIILQSVEDTEMCVLKIFVLKTSYGALIIQNIQADTILVQQSKIKDLK